ncbi:transcriptional regulator, TetR family [Anaerocolumna jejuensis DSM 15929]|uniref:Transcriptional regulator, TetR family n=1 Tax=Anaerocolumna jejuensis DSM 15929 TaxID=1121322 RepID=A0A1M6RWH3_9FIRM|nr:TetR/AcrR family transcriptional regulator [Anaerocolumna jejuensis]SHK36649.1 transcriptional regulator, TetR family [Anaerocolumna jejuensis DSM 15929]
MNNGKSSSRNPQQKRSVQRKEDILDVAMFLFSSKGFYNTTTNEIAKTAKISIGNLYFYFPDKDTILIELLERYNQHFLSVYDDINTAENVRLYQSDKKKWLYNLIDNLIVLHESTKNFSRELNVLYYARPEVAALVDAQSEKVRLATLDGLVQHKEDLQSEDMEALSVVIVDYISALVDRIVFKDNIVDKQRILRAGIEALYKGLLI